MLIHHHAAKTSTMQDPHGGSGLQHCAELLTDPDMPSLGIRYVRKRSLPPGGSIGPHLHPGEERLFVVLEGRGSVDRDGAHDPLYEGDVLFTRHKLEHFIHSSRPHPLRLLEIACRLDCNFPRDSSYAADSHRNANTAARRRLKTFRPF